MKLALLDFRLHWMLKTVCGDVNQEAPFRSQTCGSAAIFGLCLQPKQTTHAEWIIVEKWKSNRRWQNWHLLHFFQRKELNIDRIYKRLSNGESKQRLVGVPEQRGCWPTAGRPAVQEDVWIIADCTTLHSVRRPRVIPLLLSPQKACSPTCL